MLLQWLLYCELLLNRNRIQEVVLDIFDKCSEELTRVACKADVVTASQWLPCVIILCCTVHSLFLLRKELTNASSRSKWVKLLNRYRFKWWYLSPGCMQNSGELIVVRRSTLVVESQPIPVWYVLLVVSRMSKRPYLHVKNMIVLSWNVNGFLVVFGHTGPHRFRLNGYLLDAVVSVWFWYMPMRLPSGSILLTGNVVINPGWKQLILVEN